MQVNEIGKREFMELVHGQTDEFMRRISEPQAFLVKGFYPSAEIIHFRNQAFESGLTSESSWHALLDGCPDYHRLHDNYPQAYVKQKMHGFYYHSWHTCNKKKFDYFRDIFSIKNFLAGIPEDEFLDNIPSDGLVARINIHHYPKGGGYQAEHIDPSGAHAQIQTLVIASQIGEDFHCGGVYARALARSERVFLDGGTSPGDLLVLSPAIQHGVDDIDPDVPYEYGTNDGRWIILPVIVNSDYPDPRAIKPMQVAGSV